MHMQIMKLPLGEHTEEGAGTGIGAGCAWLVRYSVTFHYGKDGGCPLGQVPCKGE